MTTPVNTTANLRDLTMGNGEGTRYGQTPTDPISFYGSTPIVQPSGASQAAVARGASAASIATYSSTQSPSAVSANTTAEQTLTVQSGTGATMLLASGDLLFANKPTAQAGLGMGNVRVSSSNTLGVTFGNWTSGSITPTASQVYSVVGLRGLPLLSATLSPAAVAANSTVEQQFAVSGLSVGLLVQVMKPTAQAGIDIVGCRVVSANVLGITFANVTASPVTPTAAESYSIYGLSGLDAANNEIGYGFNVGTVGAIGAGIVVTGGNTTLTGVLATDMTTGIYKPTSGAAATNAAYPVEAILTANTATLYFGGIGTGATPTGSEVYGIKTYRINPAAPLVTYTPSIAPASVAANTTAEQTFTVTGLVAGSPVWVNKPSWTNGLGIAGVRVSAANTLAINFTNSTATAIVPPTETYIVGNFQVPAPGAGNSVYQTILSGAASALSNAMRSALVSMGLIAGA